MGTSIIQRPAVRALGGLAFVALSTVALGQQEVFRFDGVNAVDRFGWSVKGAGDVNGDGFDDMIVGAPTDSPGGVFKAGSVRVYSGANGSQLYYWTGSQANDYYGWAVSGAGDVDADGYDDLVISAPRTPSAGSNYAQVRSGLNGSILYSFSGSAVDTYGYSVAAAGDVDSDGHDDVLIGAPQHNVAGGKGYAHVRSGANGWPIRVANGVFAGDRFGWSVSGGGDANGDGVSDFAVGAPQHFTGAGYVFVYSGGSGSLYWLQNGAAIGDYFGHSICLERDVDADNLADLIVGAPRTNPGGLPNAGRVRVYSGTVIELWTFDGEAVDDLLGWSVCSADTNGDGYSDVVVGIPGDDAAFPNAGRVRVFSGQSGWAYFSFVGKYPDHVLGSSVGRVGHVAGDPWPGTMGPKDAVIGGAPRGGEIFDPGTALVYWDDLRLGGSYCKSTVNSSGLPGRMTVRGSDVVSENYLVLEATQCPANTFGFFFFGSLQANIPLGDGVLCVNGNMVRLTPPDITDGGGLAERKVDLTAPPVAGVIVPGTTWNFQFWFRDPAGGPAGSNFTDAVQVDFR